MLDLSPSTLPEAPSPPRYDLWPEALRSAERLRGTLVPCGPGLRGVGWPETPRVRLAAIAPWLGGGRIAVYLTAAWVWGAARNPGHPLRVSTTHGGRATTVAQAMPRVHQLRLSPAECSRFGDFSVTTPLRTATDLLYDDERFGTSHRVAVRLLLPLIDGGRDALQAHLYERVRPKRSRALDRLCGAQEREAGDSAERQPPFMR